MKVTQYILKVTQLNKLKASFPPYLSEQPFPFSPSLLLCHFSWCRFDTISKTNAMCYFAVVFAIFHLFLPSSALAVLALVLPWIWWSFLEKIWWGGQPRLVQTNAYTPSPYAYAWYLFALTKWRNVPCVAHAHPYFACCALVSSHLKQTCKTCFPTIPGTYTKARLHTFTLHGVWSWSMIHDNALSLYAYTMLHHIYTENSSFTYR